MLATIPLFGGKHVYAALFISFDSHCFEHTFQRVWNCRTQTLAKNKKRLQSEKAPLISKRRLFQKRSKKDPCTRMQVYTSLHIMLLGDIILGGYIEIEEQKTRWKLTNSTFVLGLLHGLLDCFYGCKLFVCLLLNSHSFRKQIAPRGRESTPPMYKKISNINIYKWNNLSTYWEHWYAWRETTTVHLVKSY